MAVHDGDGWVDCRCGLQHWGLYGAAGILVLREKKILLQHRAPWVHNGDTWGIPGGARDSHESALEAAIREAQEEIGLDVEKIEPLDTFRDDHGNWHYETVLVRTVHDFVHDHMNAESLQVAWFDIADLPISDLHPSFAKSWPELSSLITKFLI